MNFSSHLRICLRWNIDWCIIASLNYKNTMINRIIMETVACLRSKCHLKQNVTPSWPWSFWHTSDNYTLWYIYFQETSMIQTQTFWNSSDRKGRKSQGPAILPSMLVMLNTSKLLFKSHTAIGFYVKTMSAYGSHLGWRSWSPDTILKVYYPRTIHAMFALNCMGKKVLKSSPLKLVSQI
jgi:hypothetical protein